jgi:hypothetical protein
MDLPMLRPARSSIACFAMVLESIESIESKTRSSLWVAKPSGRSLSVTGSG